MKTSLETGIHFDDTKIIIETFLRLLIANWVKGVKISISGFGIFTKKTVAAKVGRNFKTNQPLEIPERSKLVFNISKLIQQPLNKQLCQINKNHPIEKPFELS